ncbi:hypothetical protein ACFL6U_14825 [Planctomycetota bacterium]
MKSEHRHELKTNELADWIAHIPEWSKQNARTLYIAAAVAVVAIAIFAWHRYSNRVLGPRRQLRLTHLMTQVDVVKGRVIQEGMQGKDMSSLLQETANGLATFAQSAGDPILAANAYLQRAKALRAELHLRLSPLTPEALATQIQQAQESYNQALEKGQSEPLIRSAAQYGLGLCAEELGTFADASKIYSDLVADESLAGTPAQAAAEYRLQVMDNYATAVSFPPAPNPVEVNEPVLNLNIPEIVPVPTAEPTPAPGDAGEKADN